MHILIILFCLLAAPQAFAAEELDLATRLREIEGQIANLSKSSTPSDPSGTMRLNATTLAQLEEIKEQVKGLRGDIEQLQFDSARLNERLVKLSADTEFRFNELEKKNKDKEKSSDAFADIDQALDNDEILQQSDSKAHDNKAAKDAASNKETSTDPFVAKKIKDKAIKEAYDSAYSFLKARNYKRAREEFTEFLKNNPESEYSGNAHYWLGETYFLTSKFDKAAVEYLKGYQVDIRGSRASDNLLKLGKSLSKLEKRKEACTTFAKLKKEFPSTSSTIKKELEEELKNLRCGS